MSNLSFLLQKHILISLGVWSHLSATNPQSRYFIKEDYTPKTTYTHFDDTTNQDNFQYEVYSEAKAIVENYHPKQIADIGCGSSFKIFSIS